MVVGVIENTFGKCERNLGQLISTTRVVVLCDSCLQVEWETEWNHREKRDIDRCVNCRFVGENNINYGKPRTKEVRQKIRETLKGKYAGEKAYWYGKHLSQETKETIANLRKGKSPVTKGKTYVEFYGKEKADLMKQKQREVAIVRPHKYKDTVPEKALQQLLQENNIPFEKQKKLYGRPDIFIEPNICIFADGDYYHNYGEIRFPRAAERDPKVNAYLAEKGYIVLRFWEHEIKENIEICLQKIKEVL